MNNSSEASEALIQAIFGSSPAVRYVAVYRNGKLETRQRTSVENASASESDFYEEVLVNPTLLLLAKQRGQIDCGGLEYLVVRYGQFFQFIQAIDEGHVSACLEPTSNVTEDASKLAALIGGCEEYLFPNLLRPQAPEPSMSCQHGGQAS